MPFVAKVKEPIGFSIKITRNPLSKVIKTIDLEPLEPEVGDVMEAVDALSAESGWEHNPASRLKMAILLVRGVLHHRKPKAGRKLAYLMAKTADMMASDVLARLQLRLYKQGFYLGDIDAGFLLAYMFFKGGDSVEGQRDLELSKLYLKACMQISGFEIVADQFRTKVAKEGKLESNMLANGMLTDLRNEV
jgi:TPR repeat protein